MERVIFHCDLNSFFASVELLDYPELRHLPVAVCGDPASRHGIILAKNEPAKKFGVKTAETIWQAKKKCPELVLLASHHDLYREYSKKVNAIYEQYTDLVEPFGIDESWLDVTGTVHLFGGDPRAMADRIRNHVRSELGLTLSVGVSFNKIFAKLGSDYKKPDATTVIRPEDIQTMVWPLPVTDLLFVGRAAARELERYGVTTIGQLAAFDRQALGLLLGRQGYVLHDYANGLEHSPVQPAGTYTPPKSVGNGLTFPHNLAGEEQVRSGVTLLADCVAQRLRRHALKCTGIQVSVRSPEFHDLSRQRKLSSPTFVTPELADAAMDLIRANWNLSAPIRAITITAILLIPAEQAGGQMDLFSQDSFSRLQERREQLGHAMDDIRSRFGEHAIGPASQLSGHSPERSQTIPPPKFHQEA
ncbi:MAG: DNA polymerase IV [Oscillospiraceae bacterium]|nr:DNA polymerase IV [Oscillospiraceae bacterium]